MLHLILQNNSWLYVKITNTFLFQQADRYQLYFLFAVFFFVFFTHQWSFMSDTPQEGLRKMDR